MVSQTGSYRANPVATCSGSLETCLPGSAGRNGRGRAVVLDPQRGGAVSLGLSEDHPVEQRHVAAGVGGELLHAAGRVAVEAVAEVLRAQRQRVRRPGAPQPHPRVGAEERVGVGGQLALQAGALLREGVPRRAPRRIPAAARDPRSRRRRCRPAARRRRAPPPWARGRSGVPAPTAARDRRQIPQLSVTRSWRGSTGWKCTSSTPSAGSPCRRDG
jgi:hypothetical protein